MEFLFLLHSKHFLKQDHSALNFVPARVQNRSSFARAQVLPVLKERQNQEEVPQNQVWRRLDKQLWESQSRCDTCGGPTVIGLASSLFEPTPCGQVKQEPFDKLAVLPGFSVHSRSKWHLCFLMSFTPAKITEAKEKDYALLHRKQPNAR